MNFGSAPTSAEQLPEDMMQSLTQQQSSGGDSTSGMHPVSQVKNSLLGNGSVSQSSSRPSMAKTAPRNEQLHQAKQLISPIGFIQTAAEQISGGPSEEEQQRRQQDIARDQQRMMQEKQTLDSFRQKQTMQKQHQRQTNAQLASEASAFSETPILQTGDSKTEQVLLEKILSDGQAQATRQKQAASLPSSPQKGPNMGNSKPKADMMAAMQPDRKKPKKAEPAAHELPLGE